MRVNGREVVGRSKESWEIGGMVESVRGIGVSRMIGGIWSEAE